MVIFKRCHRYTYLTNVSFNFQISMPSRALRSCKQEDHHKANPLIIVDDRWRRNRTNRRHRPCRRWAAASRAGPGSVGSTIGKTAPIFRVGRHFLCCTQIVFTATNGDVTTCVPTIVNKSLLI